MSFVGHLEFYLSFNKNSAKSHTVSVSTVGVVYNTLMLQGTFKYIKSTRKFPKIVDLNL